MNVREVARQLAKKGRKGDDTLMHVSKGEIANLRRAGHLTVNPVTGLPEGFSLRGAISDIGHTLSDVTHDVGHVISQGAKNNPDPLNPSSTAKQRAILGLIKNPNESRIDRTYNSPDVHNVDIASLGPLASQDSRARQIGRNVGIVAGSYGVGTAAGALGAGTVGSAGASAATGAAARGATANPDAPPEQVAGPVDVPPVDQSTVDNAGIGGNLPEQLSGPVSDSSAATDAAFGGGGDTIVPSSTDFSSSDSGGFDTPSGNQFGSGGGSGDPGTTMDQRLADLTAEKSNWGDFTSKALKYSPLALGGVSAIAQKVAYNRAAAHINAIGGPQRDLGNQLISQFNSGALNAADQAALDKWTATAIAQSKQYFANSGQSSSTASLQSQRDIATQANAMRAQMLQNMLMQGTQLLNIGDQYQLAAVQAELKGDTALASSLGSFMSVYAKWLATSD